MKTQMENTKRLNSNLRKNITFYEMIFTSAIHMYAKIGCLQVLKIDTKIAVRGDKEKTGNMNRNKLYPKYYRLVQGPICHQCRPKEISVRNILCFCDCLFFSFVARKLLFVETGSIFCSFHYVSIPTRHKRRHS